MSEDEITSQNRAGMIVYFERKYVNAQSERGCMLQGLEAVKGID